MGNPVFICFPVLCCFNAPKGHILWKENIVPSMGTKPEPEGESSNGSLERAETGVARGGGVGASHHAQQARFLSLPFPAFPEEARRILRKHLPQNKSLFR